jgi:hypothetical protein
MANLQKRLDVTELDFDTIKSNLINYFKNTEPFKDYDYSGSGLNQLLDVLSYNTHYNAMLAHTAVNESFIDTAQIRSSVVSNAKLLGYVPRSKTAPSINVKVEFGMATGAQTNPNTYINLPRGSNFKTTYGDDTFIYTTLDDYKLELNVTTSRYTGTNILLKEGSLRRNRFALSNSNDKNVYQIDDDNVDISSMILRVYDSSNASSFEVYRNFTTIELTNESNLASAPLYFLSENAYGKYQISFSNTGTFGKKPPNLGIVEIEYLTTTGAASNGAKTFSYVGSTILYTSSQFIPIVTPNSTVDEFGNVIFEKSFGGNERESIDSIRLNAPAAFVAQNRAVTANDYKSLIYSNFSIAKSIAVWGGESNVPPQYGNVYISIQPQTDGENGVTLTPAEKQDVLNFLDAKRILSISPVLVDPQRISLVLDVLFKYNNNLSVLSQNQLQNKVYNVIGAFNRDNLDSFEKLFRHSTLLRSIDTSDPAILNSLVRVFVSKTIDIKAEQTLNEQTLQPERITIDFGTSLTVLDGKTIASFQGYTYKGRTIYLGDEASNVTNIRNVFQYTLENGLVSKFKGANGIDAAPIGTIDLEKGILTVESLQADDDVTVYIDVIPSSNDIAPKRNQLLTIDMSRLNITADVDTIASGGSSRAVDYQPFSRER